MTTNEDPWAALRHTPTGEEVAVDQVVLFFNNATHLYAAKFISPDKSTKENVAALIEAGFEKEMAEALMRRKNMYAQDWFIKSTATHRDDKENE